MDRGGVILKARELFSRAGIDTDELSDQQMESLLFGIKEALGDAMMSLGHTLSSFFALVVEAAHDPEVMAELRRLNEQSETFP